MSDFRYEPAEYVVTGNLSIVENRKLRKLLSKGPSCREKNNINWDINQKIAVRIYTKRSGSERKK